MSCNGSRIYNSGCNPSRELVQQIAEQLATKAVRDSDLPETTAVQLSDFVAIVQEGENRKIGISNLLKAISEETGSAWVFLLEVFCKNGANMLRVGESATLEARVRIGADDITDDIPQSYFSWERSSKNHTQDMAWNLRHQGVGNVIEVERIDVNRACTFFCFVPIQSLIDLRI